MPASEHQPILVVLGMHRSGTSLCANMLAAMGADMAESPGATPHNARGHWERSFVVDLNDRIFGLYGRRWADPAHILAMPEHWLNDPRVLAMQEEASHWLRGQLAGPQIFGIKDPRVTRLLPFWQTVLVRAGASPTYILCLREPGQVARSIQARDGISPENAEIRWLHYNAAAVRGIGATPVCVIPYEDWFTRPEQTAERLAAHAGLMPPAPAMPHAVIDNLLRHDQPRQARPLARQFHRGLLRGVETSRFGASMLASATLIQDCECQFQPVLVESEILRVSAAAQARVIGDLNGLIEQLRPARAA